MRTWLTERDPDLMKHGRRWLAGSFVVLLVAVAGIVARGLDLGVEFTGGRLRGVLHASHAVASTTRARRWPDAGFPRAVVQECGEDDISVRTGELTNDEEVEIRAALADASGGEVDQGARRADRAEPRRRAAAARR